jgi:hypothetical protein
MKSVPGDFWMWFSKFNAEEITGFIAVVLLFQRSRRRRYLLYSLCGS